MSQRATARPTPPDELTRLIQHGRDREAADLAARHLDPDGGTPMDPRHQLREILPLLDDLVAGLDDEQLGRPTPCVGFTVRGVLEHMVGGATRFAAAFRGTAPDDGGPTAGTDLVAAFPAAMADLEAAIGAPGALDRTVSAPFGDVPGEVFARFVALDGLVHGWDLATATGQAYAPPDDVIAAVEEFAHAAVTDDLRDGDTFAAAVTPPAGATPLVRLVAFTGRRV